MCTWIHQTGNHCSYAIVMLSLFAVNSWCPLFADDPNNAGNNTDDRVGKLPKDTDTPTDSQLQTLARTIKQQVGGNVSWSTRDGRILLAVDLRTANDERLEQLQPIVGDLAHVTAFDLSRSQISDSALSHLSNFTTLQFLDLSETQIGDSGLEHLKDMTSITSPFF